MSIDGAGNSVYEVDSIPEPDPALNPHHNAWITQGHVGGLRGRRCPRLELVDRPVLEGRQPVEEERTRTPVAYKLMPKDVVPVMVQEAPTSTTVPGSCSTTCG